MPEHYSSGVGKSNATAERALQRMLAAEDANGQGRGGWDDWQRAAVDYWLLLHPNQARLRRGDPTRIPTVDDMKERAASLSGAMAGVPDTRRLSPPTRERAEHLARVAWFHELLAGLYGPIDDALDRLRRGDQSGVQTLVRFLEADVYCFRSGYMKADVIHFLTRADLDTASMSRLRQVVVAAVDGFDRRDFRAYIRLARRLDSETLRQELTSRAGSSTNRSARHAQWMLAGLTA